MRRPQILLSTLLIGALTAASPAQDLPDLTVEGVYLNPQGQVTVRIKNLGGRLPDEVWTNRRPESTSVLLSRENQRWGGATIWSLDPQRQLQNPQGWVEWTSNLKVNPGTRVEATLDSTNQLAESNKNNNRWSGPVQTQSASQPANPPSPQANANPPQTPPAVSSAPFLSNTQGFNLDKVKTIVTMQEHIQWISQPSEADVLRSLNARGYQVEGNRLISSESNDPYLSQLTTERLRSYVAVQGNDVVICFRGTLSKGNAIETLGNMVTDANILRSSPSFFFNTSRLSSAQRNARVHLGFNNGYSRLRPQIMAALNRHRGKNVYVFGHSLGGALASLCALDLRINMTDDFGSVTHIVSGSPRVGDGAFRPLFERLVRNNLRVVVQGDPVAMIPGVSAPKVPGRFVHAGNLFQMGADGVWIRPNDIETRLRNSNPVQHGNKVYLEAAKLLLLRAGQANYFQDKGQVFTQMADAERRKSQ